jgi:hypothetical protein
VVHALPGQGAQGPSNFNTGIRGGRSDITSESKSGPSEAEQQKRLEYQEELRMQMEKKK